MKSKTKNKALKRLIPAVAMLAMSATMLSTATYAWFTMNKEVKMTGLNMTATVGEGIEIALAQVNDSGLEFKADSQPDDTSSASWKSSVIVGNYYESFGKIAPSSSVDGKNFFNATDASEGGTKASVFETVSSASKVTNFIVTRNTLDTSKTTVDLNGTEGYYVDIPVHIRTSKVANGNETSGNLYCKAIINNNGGGDSKDLFKAVRIAFIPRDGDTVSRTKIFGVDKTYYNPDQAVNSVSDRGAVTVVTDGMSQTDSFDTGVGVDSGLKIPYAGSSGAYGHLNFTVRVWLEGESEFCNDTTAGQNWKIDLAFSLGEFETTTPNP